MTEGNLVLADVATTWSTLFALSVVLVFAVLLVLLSFVVAVPELVWTFSSTRRLILLLTTKLNQQ